MIGVFVEVFFMAWQKVSIFKLITKLLWDFFHKVYKAQLTLLTMIKMKKILSKIRIPLDSLSKEKLDEIEKMHGRILVVKGEEPCLTCGRSTKRIKYTQRVDGKLWLVEECLFCMVKVKTARNRESN